MQIQPNKLQPDSTGRAEEHPLSPRGRSAFTLVEVMISVAVLSVSSMALFCCFSSGFFNMRMARENQRAIQIMLDKTETIRLYNWTQINSNGFVPTTFTNIYDPQVTNSAQTIVYTGTVHLTNAPYNVSYSNDLKQLIITLTWRTGNV